MLKKDGEKWAAWKESFSIIMVNPFLCVRVLF